MIYATVQGMYTLTDAAGHDIGTIHNVRIDGRMSGRWVLRSPSADVSADVTRAIHSPDLEIICREILSETYLATV